MHKQRATLADFLTIKTVDKGMLSSAMVHSMVGSLTALHTHFGMESSDLGTSYAFVAERLVSGRKSHQDIHCQNGGRH